MDDTPNPSKNNHDKNTKQQTKNKKQNQQQKSNKHTDFVAILSLSGGMRRHCLGKGKLECGHLDFCVQTAKGSSTTSIAFFDGLTGTGTSAFVNAKEHPISFQVSGLRMPMQIPKPKPKPKPTPKPMPKPKPKPMPMPMPMPMPNANASTARLPLAPSHDRSTDD